jgi:enoyl-CoA hydratase/carnithine racemase
VITPRLATAGRCHDTGELYEFDGKVGIVAHNRPAKLNALSMELKLELELRHADDDASISVIALRAERRSFCVGADGRDPARPPYGTRP